MGRPKLYDLYQEAHTPWDWHRSSSPRPGSSASHLLLALRATAIELLEQLGAPAFKIASFEIVDLPLIVARRHRQAADHLHRHRLAGEIAEAVEAAATAGDRRSCCSIAPAAIRRRRRVNHRTLPHLGGLLGVVVGLSDHTLGVVAVAAVALGAVFVEKHFTLSRAEGGVDSAFSLEPTELASLMVETQRAWQALGTVHYGPTEAERKSLVFRRSVYVAQDVQAGETFTLQNLRIVRPGRGLHPRFYEQLLGRRASGDISKGTPMSWDLLA